MHSNNFHFFSGSRNTWLVIVATACVVAIAWSHVRYEFLLVSLVGSLLCLAVDYYSWFRLQRSNPQEATKIMLQRSLLHIAGLSLILALVSGQFPYLPLNMILPLLSGWSISRLTGLWALSRIHH